MAHKQDQPTSASTTRQFQCHYCDGDWIDLGMRSRHHHAQHPGKDIPKRYETRDYTEGDLDGEGSADQGEESADQGEDTIAHVDDHMADTADDLDSETIRPVDIYMMDASPELPDHVMSTVASITQDTCVEYNLKMWEVRRSVLSAMHDFVHQEPDCNYKTRTTIAGEYLYAVRKDIKRMVAPLVINSEAYFTIVRDPEADQYLSTTFQNAVVLATSSDARELLAFGPPQLPILIPAAGNAGQRLVDPAVYDLFLMHKPEIEYHFLGDRLDALGRTHVSSPAKIIDYIGQEGNGPPINMLNLAECVEAEAPAFLAGIREYNFVRSVREGDVAGKQAKERVRDFTSAARFTLYAAPWAVSVAHRDAAGSITRVRAEKGAKKLWMMWPSMTDEQTSNWADAGDGAKGAWSPPARPTAVLLEEGDTLIMPMGCVHSVLTLTKSLMTGEKMWNTMALVQVARQVLTDMRSKNVTNEDIEYECVDKLTVAEAEWTRTLAEGNGYWKFGGQDELSTFRGLLKVGHCHRCSSLMQYLLEAQEIRVEWDEQTKRDVQTAAKKAKVAKAAKATGTA